MKIIIIYKYVLLWFCLIMSFDGCLVLDVAANAHQMSLPLVSIRYENIEFEIKNAGKIGYCGVFDDYLLKNQDSIIKYYIKKMDVNFQNEYFEEFKLINMTNCRSNRSKTFSGYRYVHLPTIGYVNIFDIEKENHNWEMYPGCLEFLNEKFACDFYFVGVVSGEYIGSTMFANGSRMKVSFMPVLYDRTGRKVWSHIFTKQFEASKDSSEPSQEYYDNFLILLDESKPEIVKVLQKASL
jgi:hypothetical protein